MSKRQIMNENYTKCITPPAECSEKQGMVWNRNFDMVDARMEWKTIFHIRFRALCLQKNMYACRIVINNITEEPTSIFICRQIALLRLCVLRKQCTYCIILSILQFDA